MYSIVYLFILIIIFTIIYIVVNYITVLIFNKDKQNFKLKKKSKYRLEKDYTFGTSTHLNELTNGSLNCSTSEGKLIECDIDKNNEFGVYSKCLQCKQLSARCIHVSEPVYKSTSSDVVIIEANSSSEKGYCLPSDIISSNCTRKNGGKWILTQRNSNVNNDDERSIIYKFECFCSTPQFFQNNIFDGNNCTTFLGCRNGYLRNSDTWESYEDMKCSCPSDLYEERYGTKNEPPSCIPLNVYRRKYSAEYPFEVLDTKYIAPEYLSLLKDHEISLPNPCSFDITTKRFVKNIGRVVFDRTGTIAYCKPIHSSYKAIIINDDYLKGNGGKYANAMFRFRINNLEQVKANNQTIKTENNDDEDDYYNNYDSGIMYEVYRKNAVLNNISGVRVPYNNFPIYLPYLENDSYNMGNPYGRHYSLHPVIPKNRHSYAMVYIYDVNVPNYKINITLGNGIQYIPSFMSTSLISSYRVYNGTIPCVSVTEVSKRYKKRVFRIMYPLPPGTKYTEKLGKVGLMGDLYKIDETSSRFTSGYAFHFSYKGRIEPYTLLFTGTIFTYTIKNEIYTRPVSCGDIVLTNKYRFNFDKNWQSIPKEPIIGLPPNDPFQFAVTGRDGHMFTRNSYDIERNEIGAPAKSVARYDTTENKIKFQTFYS